MNQFNYQAILQSNNFKLNTLKAEHFKELYQVASNPHLWAGHPSPERYQLENFQKWFDSALNSQQALVITDIRTNKLIGSTRFYNFDSIKSEVYIGYTFIDCDYWGGKANAEIKNMMIQHALHSVDSVLFDVDPTNIRSQKALEKIGAVFLYKEKKTLSKDTEYLVYKVSKQESEV